MEIVKGSKLSYTSALDIFSLPDTNFSVTDSRFIQITPTHPIKDQNLINITLPASLYAYYDLYNSFCLITCKVLTSNGGVLAATDDVAVSNFFFRTMFKNCTVSVQEKQISDSNNLYAYRSVLPEDLSQGQGVKTSTLTSQIYYRDDTPEDFTTANKGYKARKDLCSGSKSFDMIGRLSDPLFEQNRWIIPGIRIDIALTKNSDEFCLDSKSSSAGYKFIVEDFKFFAKQHMVNPEIVKKHNTTLSHKTKALYPMRSIDVRSAHIPTGALSFVTEALFPSKIPSYLLLGLVSSEAFYGNYTKSGFNFKNYDVSSVSVKCEEDTLLYRTIKVNYESNLFQFAYASLFAATGTRNGGNFITREDFVNKGYCLYLFELMPLTDSNQFNPTKKGLIKVKQNVY